MSTHQQLIYHIVFSTKNRQRWLTDGFREKVFCLHGRYRQGAQRLCDQGWRFFYDHVHLLVRIQQKLLCAIFVATQGQHQ